MKIGGVEMIEKNLLEGYEDLFDEDGFDPDDVKQRAKNQIFRIKSTKKHVRSLVKQQIRWRKKDLEKLDTVTEELTKLTVKKDSEYLKQLIKEKKFEKKETKDMIGIYREVLNTVENALTESMNKHEQILNKLKTPKTKPTMEAASYIG